VAWTVNTAARLQELVALGVNGIITDDPALLHRIVQEHRPQPPQRQYGGGGVEE